MRRSLSAISLLLPALALAEASAPELANPALPPVEILKVQAHPALTLAKDGKVDFAIVGRFKEELAVRGPGGEELRAFKRDSVGRAAAVLREAFEKCLGCKPPQLEEDDPKVSGFKYVIALGTTKWSEKLGLKPDELPREGFEIRTFPGGVCIAGMDGFRIDGFYDIYNWKCGRLTCNGTEQGAIDFVERFLDVRKFTNRGKGLWTVMPKRTELVVPACAYRDHPRYWTRWPMNENWRSGISSDFFGGEAPKPFDLAKAHPDKLETIFYRDRNGRLWQDPKDYGGNFLDVTNPEFADVLVDDFKAYFANEGKGSYWGTMWAPTSRYVWFGQCDRGFSFDNDRAAKLVRERPSACDVASEIYGNFYDCLARRCQRELPGRTVVLMAYSNYLLPPRTVKRFPDNVQILACLGTPALVRSDRYRKVVGRVYDAWDAMCAADKRCVPYTYDLNYTSRGMIVQLMRGRYEGEFLRWAAAHTAPNLVYTCLAREPRDDASGYGNELSSYLVFRALWNPAFDAAAGTRDFFWTTCGAEAAEHLVRICDLLAARWEADYLPTFEKGPYFRFSMNNLECFRSIPYTEFAQLYTSTIDAGTAASVEAELKAAEGKLGDDPDRRKRFAAFAGPLRKTLDEIATYRQKAGTGSLVLTSTRAEQPRLNVFTVAGTVTPRGVKTEMRWDEKGLYVWTTSRYAPFGGEKPLGEGASFDLMLAPGETPANVYRFQFGSNGEREDWRKQLDPPRPTDVGYHADGVRFVSTADDAKRLWTAEMFVPWKALYERPPKKGDVWRMNFAMRRPDAKNELSSFAPTFGDLYREDLFAKVRFE